uniref:Uncharacterized protein n=1 Tax=Anopheles arabiensis TaxID=7173 RepID=A0A182HQT0_ANOAR
MNQIRRIIWFNAMTVTAEKSLIQELINVLQGMTIKTEEPKITDETTNSAIRRDTLVPLPYFDGQLKDLPLFKKISDGTTKDAKFWNFENLRRIQQYEKPSEAYDTDLVYKDLLKDILKVLVNRHLQIPESVENLVINITSLNHYEYLNDPRLVNEIVEKLPIIFQYQWSEYNQENGDQI